MSTSELLPFLLGGGGCLVLSLTLNYAFWKGWLLNPRKTVLLDQYEQILKITERNTVAVEKIAGKRSRDPG